MNVESKAEMKPRPVRPTRVSIVDRGIKDRSLSRTLSMTQLSTSLPVTISDSHAFEVPRDVVKAPERKISTIQRNIGLTSNLSSTKNEKDSVIVRNIVKNDSSIGQNWSYADYNVTAANIAQRYDVHDDEGNVLDLKRIEKDEKKASLDTSVGIQNTSARDTACKSYKMIKELKKRRKDERRKRRGKAKMDGDGKNFQLINDEINRRMSQTGNNSEETLDVQGTRKQNHIKLPEIDMGKRKSVAHTLAMLSEQAQEVTIKSLMVKRIQAQAKVREKYKPYYSNNLPTKNKRIPRKLETLNHGMLSKTSNESKAYSTHLLDDRFVSLIHSLNDTKR